MTQKEIIEFEETNTGVIRLYLEGSFYKAYQHSACLVHLYVHEFKLDESSGGSTELTPNGLI